MYRQALVFTFSIGIKAELIHHLGEEQIDQRIHGTVRIAYDYEQRSLPLPYLLGFYIISAHQISDRRSVIHAEL